MDLTINLRNDKYAVVSGFKSVEYFLPDKQSIPAENISSIEIKPGTTYSFIGSSNTVTINGADIFFLELAN